MNKTVWLIEATNPRTGQAEYIKEIDRDGTYDVYFTKHAHEAIPFRDRIDAEAILNDWGFQRAFGGNHPFRVAEHMFLDGPTQE